MSETSDSLTTSGPLCLANITDLEADIVRTEPLPQLLQGLFPDLLVDV